VLAFYSLSVCKIHAENSATKTKGPKKGPKELPGCFKGFKKAFTTPDKVFISTLLGPTGVSKHTQMGYLSYYDESHYPLAIPSGQGVMTVDTGISACAALGPTICAGFQIFYCPVDEIFTSSPNWINLLTPIEVTSNPNGEVFTSTQVTGAAYIRC
jgi:hypothetical protein